MKTLTFIACIMMSAVAFGQTTQNASYLIQKENKVVSLINEARTAPRSFAENHLKNNSLPAAQECYREMIAMSPLPALIPTQALSSAAKDHAEDMGRNGRTGHAGSDGSTLISRIGRYGNANVAIAENCSYGYDDPLRIVLQLLIDDGVADRGHRKNIFNSDLKYIGVSIKPHTQYSHNCVMDFAQSSQPSSAPASQPQIDIQALRAYLRRSGLPQSQVDQYIAQLQRNTSAASQPSLPANLEIIKRQAEALGIPGDVITEYLKQQRPRMSKGELVDMVSRMDNKKVVELMDKIGVAPNLGIQQRRPFWQLGAGPHSLPLPIDSVVLPRFNFAYVWVDESVIQLYEVKLSLSTENHIVDFGYGIGFGGSWGFWHIGLLVNLGYAHLYEEPAGHIHGLHYALGPFLNFGLPFVKWLNSWRFHIATGWSGIAVSNADYPGKHQLEGWMVEFGAGFSIE